MLLQLSANSTNLVPTGRLNATACRPGINFNRITHNARTIVRAFLLVCKTQKMKDPQQLKLGITMGDPNGVGPELAYRCVAHCHENGIGLPVVYGSRQALQALPAKLQLGLKVAEISTAEDYNKGVLNLRSTDARGYQVNFGVPDPVAGQTAYKALEAALADLNAGLLDGILTLPINKAVIAAAGFPFPGHTEYLADRCGGQPLMSFVHGGFRLALVTAHLPLREVPAAITQSLILHKLGLFRQSLEQDFGLRQPRVAVLGLNPHAGDEGKLGTEEQEIIQPAIKAAQAEGWHTEGPFPADGFFAYGAHLQYDGILGMYHDQGLVAFKGLTKGAGVNFTAGLPVVRTSPDHGTAYALAGRGTVDPASTLEALETLQQVIQTRKRRT